MFEEFFGALRQVPLIAVLRGLETAEAVAAGLACAAGGLRTIEITMDSPGAEGALASLRRSLEPLSVIVGAGTVVRAKDVSTAVDAGAQFLVAPHLDHEVVAAGLANGLPVVPGILSPTELNSACCAGAPMVKLFPAGPAGVAHLRALRGPYPDVPIMVSGGIGLESASEWLSAGANAVGLGTSALGRDADTVRARTAHLVKNLPAADERRTAAAGVS